MTQLSNVNKVVPHTGLWWTLFKAWSSLHLGPAADVWLNIPSCHLSTFLMLPLCVSVECQLFLTHTSLTWSSEVSSSVLEDMHACQCKLMCWLSGLTPDKKDLLKVHFFNCASFYWLSFDVFNRLSPYCLNICGRSAAITLSCKTANLPLSH